MFYSLIIDLLVDNTIVYSMRLAPLACLAFFRLFMLLYHGFTMLLDLCAPCYCPPVFTLAPSRLYRYGFTACALDCKITLNRHALIPCARLNSCASIANLRPLRLYPVHAHYYVVPSLVMPSRYYTSAILSAPPLIILWSIITNAVRLFNPCAPCRY